MNRALASTQPVTRQVVTGQVVTTSGASAAFQLPNDLSEMRIIAQVTAASGTTPTLDTALQDSPDGGTTWVYTGNQMARMTGVDMRQISLSRERQASQVAAEFTGNIPATGAAAASGPIARLCRLWFAVGGTTPSFTVNVFIIGTQVV